MSERPLAQPYWRPSNEDSYLRNFSIDNMSVIWSRSIPEAVTDIVVNQEVGQMISQNGTYLTNPDRLLDYALMTCDPQQAHAMHIGPDLWTRSTVLSKDPMYYGSNIGRYITMKGCSITGRHYGCTSASEDPWGFFGVEDAKKEIAISNDLLAEGIKSALPIGYLELDPDVLESAAYSFWPDERRAENMIMHLRKVVRNEDQPAIMIRLTGSTHRLNDDNYGSTLEILAALTSAGLIPYSVMNTLTYRQVPNEAEMDLIHGSFDELIQRNVTGLKSLFLKNQNYRRSNLIGVLLNEKDIDAAFTHQDYEEIRWDIPSMPTVKDYQDKMKDYFDKLLQKLID